MSKVGIVVLNYNDYRETREYVDKIKKFRVLNEIVLVDNKSTDASYEVLKRMEKSNITTLESDSNKGYAYGNNVGIKYLQDKVDYIIISNSDIELEEKVIKKLKEDLDNNEDIALIGPIIDQDGEKIKGWRLPKVSDEIRLNLSSFDRLYDKKLIYDEKRYGDDLTKVDVVHGCFFMVRSDALRLIGNLYDSTFLYYEEDILAVKLRNANKKSYIDNTVEVKHVGSTTVDSNYNRIAKYKMIKNSQKYYVKQYLHANVFEMFILRFIYRIRLIFAYIGDFFKKIFKKKK